MLDKVLMHCIEPLKVSEQTILGKSVVVITSGLHSRICSTKGITLATIIAQAKGKTPVNE